MPLAPLHLPAASNDAVRVHFPRAPADRVLRHRLPPEDAGGRPALAAATGIQSEGDPDRSRAERAARSHHQRTGKRLYRASRADRRGPHDRSPHARAFRAFGGIERGGMMRPQTDSLSTDELRKIERLLAGGQLSVGGPDLSARQPAAARAAAGGGTSSRGCSATGGPRPGLNFLYVHLNRVIKKHDLNMIYVIGPGHGGPSLVANTYLEGTYSEYYPNIGRDADGMKSSFKQFSFPGGIPSHVAPETPGSIHEGGDWATRSRTRSAPHSTIGPDRRLRRRRRRGRDRPARRGLAFQQVSEPRPRRRGSPDPASERLQDRESVRARAYSAGRAASLFAGYGYKPHFVEGANPEKMHRSWPRRSTWSSRTSSGSRRHAAAKGSRRGRAGR